MHINKLYNRVIGLSLAVIFVLLAQGCGGSGSPRVVTVGRSTPQVSRFHLSQEDREPVAAPVTTVLPAPAVAAPVAPRVAPVVVRRYVPIRVAQRATAAVRRASTAPGGIWDCIRQRESGGNYSTNTGNGYYGAYQFSLATWKSAGGTGLPSNASPAEQDARARSWQQKAGFSQWSTARGCGA